MTTTPIEWTDTVWNPIRGCTRVSEGCRNCYAERQAYRFSGPGMPYEGLVELGKTGPRWTGAIRLVPDKLGEPLSWRKPRRVFVNSMSDLFHPDVPFEYIAAVYGVMAASPRHTFQVLTKRPERAREFFRWQWMPGQGLMQSLYTGLASVVPKKKMAQHMMSTWPWPLPNVWLGTSVEDQKTADERIPELLQCPAAVRWVSAEPLLGPVDLGLAALDWVVVGGESGPSARPCDTEDIRRIVDWGQSAKVPVFVKQIGARPFERRESQEAFEHEAKRVAAETKPGWLVSPGLKVSMSDKKGGDQADWPEHLRVRQYPETKA